MDCGIYSPLKQMKIGCPKLFNDIFDISWHFVKISFGIQMIKEHRYEWWQCCGTRM